MKDEGGDVARTGPPAAPGTRVEIQVAPDFEGRVREHRMRAVAEAVLRTEGQTGELALVITGDRSIRDLNRDFLGIDAPTDVLAFPTQEKGGPFVAAPEAGGYLGDVILSYPRAEAQAHQQGHPVEQEIDLLIVHGILHLLGYDHATPGDKAAMWAHQDAILDSIWPSPEQP
jgi:probable rRNA maturation factor